MYENKWQKVHETHKNTNYTNSFCHTKLLLLQNWLTVQQVTIIFTQVEVQILHHTITQVKIESTGWKNYSKKYSYLCFSLHKRSLFSSGTKIVNMRPTVVK